MIESLSGSIPARSRDAEHPLQAQRWDRAGVHAGGLEHGREPQVLRQGDRLAVDARHVEEDLAAARARQQGRQDRFGGGAVVGDQRADLAAVPAWTDHAPGGQPAVAQERATGMSRRADPGAQERGARGREHRRVVGFHGRQRDFGQRDDTSLRRIRHGNGAAVADVGIGEPEPRLPVVFLLCHDAIEPDHARAGVRDGGIPDAQSVAAAAHVLPHDVEAQEGEARVVIDAGDGGDWSAVDLADEEAVRIHGCKARSVGEARVPAFGRRPVDGKRDFVRPHRPHAQVAHGAKPL